MGMAPARVLGFVSLAVACMLAIMAAAGDAAATSTPSSPTPTTRWLKAHATFYGGADASDTMGGACGYGNLYSQGYGTRTAALSTTLFQDGASCGQCYRIACDRKRADSSAAQRRQRPHFDMAQPAFEKTGVYTGGIIPVMYKRVPCVKRDGVRFTINGHDYFNLVLVTNVAGAGSIKSMDVKTSNSNSWIPMARNWGANWHSLAHLTGQMLSFRVTDTDGQTIEFTNVVPQGWKFGQTFASKLQFK
ncbi:hypothetical protein SORBI_3004G120000 [Sorghum bicolor]|uniref:Expansin n=1 Tax=Sorghum bicolor TaxID=4558 RepID=C5XZM2_SORBI|nr:hypothetical protein SORBI_3004G120000 [Sorghum bicolor]